MTDDLDRRLSESLKTVTEALRESRAARSVGAHADFRRRLRRRRVTRFASLATATAVVGIVAAVAATMGSDLFGDRSRDGSVDATPAGTYIRVGDDPVGVSVDGETVWVASSNGTITRVNVATNESTALVNVGGEPTDVALTEGVVWFADSQEGAVKRLSAVTPETFVGTPLPLGSQGVHIDLDVGRKGVVWATSPDFGALVSMNPETGEELRRFLVTSPVELAIARGSIWTLADGGTTLVRFDFDDGAETMRVPLGDAEKTDMAATESNVYVAQADGTILRVDASTGEIAQRKTVGGVSPELTLGDGALWVTSDLEGVDAELAGLGLADLAPVGQAKKFAGAPTDVALGDGVVWISDTGRETVVRLKTPAH